jgi:hypothetical protein
VTEFVAGDHFHLQTITGQLTSLTLPAPAS